MPPLPKLQALGFSVPQFIIKKPKSKIKHPRVSASRNRGTPFASLADLACAFRASSGQHPKLELLSAHSPLRGECGIQSQEHLILGNSVPVDELFPLTAGRNIHLGDAQGCALDRPSPRGTKSNAEIR